MTSKDVRYEVYEGCRGALEMLEVLPAVAMKNSFEFGIMQTSPRLAKGVPSAFYVVGPLMMWRIQPVYLTNHEITQAPEILFPFLTTVSLS